jgi:hypothetical protein
MKAERANLRMEPAVKRYLQAAADFDRRSLSEMLIHGALRYAEQLKARGWRAKNPPRPRDERRRDRGLSQAPAVAAAGGGS